MTMAVSEAYPKPDNNECAHTVAMVYCQLTWEIPNATMNGRCHTAIHYSGQLKKKSKLAEYVCKDISITHFSIKK